MRISETSDRRHGLDFDAEARSGTIGLDRAIGEDVVVGATLGVSESSSNLFGGMWTTDVSGSSAGPYLAIRLSDQWATDFSLIYSRSDIEMTLAGLHADLSSHAISASVRFTGTSRRKG